jgi:hypothetical protein
MVGSPDLRRVTMVAALTVAITAAPGCSADSSPAAPPTVSHFRNSVLAFSHPVAWSPYVFKATATPHVNPLLYLSTQPAHDPCKQQGSSSVCGWPIDELRPGGVLIVWENRTFPGWSLDSASGTVLRVGGRRAKRASVHPGECSSIGGDETIEVTIQRPVANSWTAVTACVRRPHLAESERRIFALLASTRFLAP